MTCGARLLRPPAAESVKNGNYGTWFVDSNTRHGIRALYLLACSGALIEIYRFTTSSDPVGEAAREERFLKVYLVAMVVLAWTAVLTRTYVNYPWYRAALPPGVTDLALFPQRLLMSSPSTTGWHSLGMEWKEHIAWFAPISITMVAFVFVK